MCWKINECNELSVDNKIIVSFDRFTKRRKNLLHLGNPPQSITIGHWFCYSDCIQCWQHQRLLFRKRTLTSCSLSVLCGIPYLFVCFLFVCFLCWIYHSIFVKTLKVDYIQIRFYHCLRTLMTLMHSNVTLCLLVVAVVLATWRWPKENRFWFLLS